MFSLRFFLFSFAAVSAPLLCHASELKPRLVGDFKTGEPVLDVASGEKRLSRAALPTDFSYNKHPYNGFDGKRVSLKALVEQDADGTFQLIPRGNVGFPTLGAFNVRSGTLAGWFRLDGKPGPLLAGRGGYLRVPLSGGEMRWELGVDAKGRLTLQTPVAQCGMAKTPPAGWAHVAAVWDADRGVRLYLNGEAVAENWWVPNAQAPADLRGKSRPAPVVTPLPVELLVLTQRPEGGLRALRLYDAPLSAAGVRQLFEGNAPETGQTEPPQPNLAVRLAALGWEKSAADTLPVAREGRVLYFRQVPVLEALENRRAAGWLAVSGFGEEGFPWSYHGYGQGVRRELFLTLVFAPNWMIGSADAFRGTVREGAHAEQPLKVNGPSFHLPLDGAGKELLFACEEGKLSRLEFYHVGETAPDFLEGTHIPPILPLRKGEPEALPEAKVHEMVSTYPPGDRLLFVPYRQEKHAPQITPLPALTTWHLASDPVQSEYALGGIGLRLRLTPLAEPTRARLVVHDPHTPGRELARVDCVLAPSPTGEYAVRIDLRETLILPGNNLWVSLTLEHESALLTGDSGSGLALLPAGDAQRAAQLWKTWEQRSARDRFERQSEARSWADVGGDVESRWWLKAASPLYRQMDDLLTRLLTRFPEDTTLSAWFAFTHPRAPVKLEEITLPPVGSHPEWAVLTLECLKQYKAFLDFWIDQRQLPNGEFGNSFNDDSDLVQDWLDMTLIADPHGKYAGSLARFAHGVATSYTATGGRDGPGGAQIKGRPVIKNGLNLRWTDVLHAYEDGPNVQPPDFVAHYDDPVRFQRLLDTVARYDGFLLTPEKDGMRCFASTGEGMAFANATSLAGSPRSKHWPLLLHAGLTAAWHTDDPALWKLLEEVARAEVADPRPGIYSAPLLQAIFQKTGETKYLEPLMDNALWKSGRVVRTDALYPNTFLRLPGLNREATLRELRSDAATRYAALDSQSLGWRDDRHLRNWLEWQLSGEEEPLLEGLRALYRQLTFLMPAYTVAEQSGDRVSPPKQLISQLYLGGVPGSRNRHFYPDFAVSYRGLEADFAARVEENTPRKLRVRLYSFAEKPVSGELRVWALEPGRYRVSHRGAGGGKEYDLHRGKGFPITLPPREEWSLSIDPVKPESAAGPGSEQ